MRRITLMWAIAIAMALPITGQAKEVIYKWVDEKGVVHYSTHPPAGQKAEKVNIYSGKGKPKAAKPATAKETAKPETTALQPKEAEPTKLKDPELCEQARKNLWNLENRSRIFIVDAETGERKLMPAEERKLRLEETQKDIEDYCED